MKRSVDDASLTALADAIRAKGGTSETLVFPDGFTAAITAIASGAGIEPTASFITLSEISKSMASYPFPPKYKNELIVWNITGDNAPGNGSVTPYAYMLWVVRGAPYNGAANGGAAWIGGSALTKPWEDDRYAFSPRSATTWSIDDSGNLTTATGVWGMCGANNTMTIYEIPLPFGEGY